MSSVSIICVQLNFTLIGSNLFMSLEGYQEKYINCKIKNNWIALSSLGFLLFFISNSVLMVHALLKVSRCPLHFNNYAQVTVNVTSCLALLVFCKVFPQIEGQSKIYLTSYLTLCHMLSSVSDTYLIFTLNILIFLNFIIAYW